PATKAVVVMHYGGAPCRMDAILEFCRARGMAVIEDACHGVGGAYKGKKMGALGDVAAFSFFSNKNMATGEGGMVTTDRDDLAERVRLLRSHGMTSLTWDRHRGHSASYDVVAHGLNYRLDEIRAAIGREQLKKLNRNNAIRRRLAREYHRLLRGEPARLLERGWLAPPLGVDTQEAAHHLMVVLAPNTKTRSAAAERLKAKGIQTSVHYPFVPGFSVFGGKEELRRLEGPQDHLAPVRPKGRTPNGRLERAREFCGRVLTLPLHPLMKDEDVRLVAAALGEM
ncbi:MAG: DegT/DnrJ/EryC1/StrS family aminotransferase, partial [Candidatus Sumerlaeota bacterium]|nr:DegT/DnrJ/EryC1/StrS family aminotransferase [Candidatus Sumerlaeota bacterium]